MLRLILAVPALLMAVACLMVPAEGAVPAESPANLLKAGELSEPGSPPKGWVADEPWMLGAFEVIDVDGRRAIRVAKPGSFIKATSPLPAGVEAVTLSWEMRHGEYVPGPQAWDVPYLHLRLLDASGKKIAEKQNRVRDAKEWSPQSVTMAVPEGAAQIQVAYGNRLKEGTIEVANIRVTPAEAGAAAEAAAPKAGSSKLSLEQVRQLADKVPAPDPAQRGATVDESKVSHTITVSTAAGELEKAFTQAKKHLAAGEGVRLSLQPGIHRIGRTLELGSLNDAAKDAVLVIESAGPGKAIIRGSREVPAAQWQAVDAGKGIYRIAWDENFGMQDAGYYTMKITQLQRREMVVLDGQPLTPVDIEKYQFTDGSGKIYNEVGLVVEEKPTKEKRGWTYEGFAGLDVLTPGTFAVADRDEETHPYKNSLLIRLPEDRQRLDGATVEVGDVAELMDLGGKNNIVLRGLALEQAASWRNFERDNSALRINSWGNHYARNILIEDTEFRNNRAQGPNINAVDGLTIRNMLVERSGNRGGRFDFVRNARFEALEFRGNNWLGEATNSIMHSTGGLGTMFVRNAEFRDSSFNDNFGFGFRSDAGWDHVDMVDCEFSNNRGIGEASKNGGGVFHEITRGPINHIRSRIEGNAERGLFLHNAENVTVEDSIIRDNGQSGLSIYINDKSRSISVYVGDEVEGTSGGWARGKAFEEVPLKTNDNTTVRNSEISTTRGADSHLIERTPGVGSKEAYDDWAKNQYHGSGNTFWNPDSREMFNGTGGSWANPEFLTLEQWQGLTGEDRDSRWAQPTGSTARQR